MKRVPWAVGVVAATACAAYVFVYLYRWEWNRAVMMAAFFVATEVALATALVLRAVRRLDEDRAAPSRPQDPAVVQRLRDVAPQRDHFAWLGTDGTRMGVFITMFVGGGVLISGLAWVIDRVAGKTAGRHMESALAGQLVEIALPHEPLIADETELLADAAPFEDDPDLRLLLGTPARR